MLSYDTKKSTLLAAISRVLLYLCQTLFMPVTMLFTNITNDICYYAGCNRHNKWYECCHIIHLLPCGRCPTQTILYHNSTVTAITKCNVAIVLVHWHHQNKKWQQIYWCHNCIIVFPLSYRLIITNTPSKSRWYNPQSVLIAKSESTLPILAIR